MSRSNGTHTMELRERVAAAIWNAQSQSEFTFEHDVPDWDELDDQMDRTTKIAILEMADAAIAVIHEK